ncbi:glycosyl transferase [Marinomonas sp. SBI22]|uniref:glycosyltransferase n=1 Tax=unclassified Marinomonas TaxID=196814 RepID=UPI0007AFA27A|nr:MULTISPECIES: glycosyltransferase [unclassified Marinomonas]KZM44900.1 glycosyl transferase [Marinomonas sp. SBI22]KZM46599.1 glycosyl transferase [Marinomonas sp. SBI8L]
MSKIAVAMSIYHGDILSNIKMSINSVLEQSYYDFDFFIEVDGVCDFEINDYLIEISSKFKNIFLNFHDVNLGLAYRLNTIIDNSLKNNYTYLARMDADDICHKDRFQKQVSFLESHENIDLVGSDVIEIDDMGKHLFYKKMETNSKLIISNVIKKCPLNHPTVMFRTSVFHDPLNRYNHLLKNTQDYYFWIDLISKGYCLSNINEPLLYFRVDKNFHKRRGLKKAFNDILSRFYAMNKLNCFSVPNVIYVFLLFGLRLSPSFIKKFSYRKYR